MTKEKILETAFELIADEFGATPYEYLDDQMNMTATMMAIWGIVRATKATLEQIEEL